MKQAKYRNQYINSALDTFLMDCPHDCKVKLCIILTISTFHLARQAGGLDAALLSPGVVCSVVKVTAAASLSPLCNLIAQRAADPEKPRQADPRFFYSECAGRLFLTDRFQAENSSVHCSVSTDCLLISSFCLDMVASRIEANYL